MKERMQTVWKEMKGESYYLPKNTVPINYQTISKKLIESIEKSDSMGTVKVTSQPAGAKVYVNGEFVGNTPYDIVQKPGRYLIELKATGQKDIKETIAISAQEARVLNFDFLVGEHKELLVNEGQLELTSSPSGGQVYLNGVLVGNTPFNLTKTPNTYNISVKHPDYVQADEQVKIEAGETNKIHLKLQKRAVANTNTEE